MEIPNKIYLEVLPHSKSKEVYKDVIKIKRTLELEDDIQYTRTDAFIEKACSWLKSKGGFTIGFPGAEIKDFKNYMEGE